MIQEEKDNLTEKQGSEATDTTHTQHTYTHTHKPHTLHTHMPHTHTYTQTTHTTHTQTLMLMECKWPPNIGKVSQPIKHLTIEMTVILSLIRLTKGKDARPALTWTW
jgi:hypothetical protein